MNSFSKVSATLAVLAVAGTLPLQPAAAQKTYIAVGDSLTFGFESFTPASSHYTPVGGSGQPGYAQAYDNFLSAQSGTTYTLLNLGIVGETSGALFTTTIPDGTANSDLNSHYTGQTQAGLLHTALTAPGSSVGVITIQVGANDVLQALETGGSAATAIANVGTSYNALLTQIRTDEGGGPLSNVTVVGYYDPFANLAPTSLVNIELRALSPGLTASLDSTLAGEAALFGARFVDLTAPFGAHLANYDDYVLANSAADTIGGFPNDHPTDLGYALIAQTLEAPEPSAFAGLATGALGLGALSLRARRRRA